MSVDLVRFVSTPHAGIRDMIDGFPLIRVLGSIPMFTMPGDESVSPWLESDGYWEAWITSWVKDNVGPDTLFVDVGSNTGYYAFVAASLGAEVLAIEANIDYANLIRRSRGVNHFYLPIYNVAVSDRAGTVTLSIPDHLHGSASIMQDFVGSQYGGRNIEVQSLTLDMLLHVVSHKPRTVIKIDAEGAEEKIWRGMCNTLVDRRPIVMLEWTPGAYSDNFYDHLTAYGNTHFINYDGGETPVDREWIESQTDWVMLAIHPR